MDVVHLNSDVYVVGERSNFKKFPTYTQDHGDGIATRGESVSTYPRRPKVEALEQHG